MKFATRYDGKHDERSKRAIFKTDKPERTKQSMKDDCDINVILKRYQATGILPNSSRLALAQYGDFSKVPSYQDALNRVMEASDMFSQLPATLRFKFQNDPGRLLSFLSDPNNREEAQALGLLKEPEQPTPQKPPKSPKEAREPTSTKSKGKGAEDSVDSPEGE